MIHTSGSKNEVINLIGDYLLDQDVFKELGEPILMRDKDIFGVYESLDASLFERGKKSIAFFCVNMSSRKAVLRYVYVHPSFRGQGVFGEMLSFIEGLCKEAGCEEIQAVSTNMALRLYLKNGYEAVKNFTNYHKIKKLIK